MENFRGCTVVLCDQTLLHKGIIAISLEQYYGYLSICKTCETFPPS